MDLAFSEADIKFRDEVRAFIDENFDDEMRAQAAKSRNGYMPKEFHVRWQKALAAKGWAAQNWPKEYGGAEWNTNQKYIYEQERARAGAPSIVPFGIKMCAPVIMKFGTQEQKDRYLPDILNTNVWWCQGYSEPGAGSDLAGLQMKAENKGDHYLVNGSKIWTSVAQYADWIFCLVRTSGEGKPQEGISFLLIDMNTPGITVEPIVTIDGQADGAQEVNQVFFQDVVVPIENRVGEENQGWTCAKYLLEFERGNAYSGALKAGLDKIRRIAATERADGTRLADDAAFQAKLAQADIDIQAMEYTELRILSRLSSGQNPGPESSLLKCRGTDLQQVVTELAVEAVGMNAVPFQPLVQGQNEEPIGPDYAAVAAPRYFNNRKVTIFAGSNEIQHNIMAKLILGM